MNARQVELTDIIINDIGGSVLEAGEGVEARYFLGFVETPEKGDVIITLVGKDITKFYSTESIRKTSEQLKVDLMTFTNNTRSIAIKFNVNSKWFLYAKSI